MKLEIKIEKSAFGGDGIGFLTPPGCENGMGKTCFVQDALPGERVVARVLQNKKNFLKARAVKVLEASPFRVEPPCPYVHHCGGCQYQHVTYAEELRIKESQVREMFERALGVDSDLVRPVAFSPRDYRYRNSVALHRTSKDNSKPQSLGFVARDNHSVVPVKNCLLADERLHPIFGAKFRLKKGADKVNFKLSEKGEIVSGEEEVFIRVKVNNEFFLVSSRSFFQNNLPVAGLVADKVAEWVKKKKPAAFFDLFSGVGTFTFLSAADVPRLFCVEESKPAVDALRMNAAERGRKDIKIIQGRAEKVLPLIFKEEESQGKSMVCIDPPRQGIERNLAEFLSETSSVSSIAYVSCDLATLVRDLKIILEKGHYEILEIAPFDMFPRTKHIEVAVLLG